MPFETNTKLDAVVPKEPKIEKLAGGFGFTEGPVWLPEAFMLFSDLPNNAIVRWHPREGVATFRQPSGFDGGEAPAGAHIGCSGLTVDRDGRHIICEHGNRRLTRLEPDGGLTVLADKFEGKRLNSHGFSCHIACPVARLTGSVVVNSY